MAVFLGDWELGNSRSREEPFSPATVLKCPSKQIEKAFEVKIRTA